MSSYVMMDYIAVFQLLFDKVVLTNTYHPNNHFHLYRNHNHSNHHLNHHDRNQYINYSNDSNIERSLILLWQLSIVTRRIDLYDLICNVVNKSSMRGVIEWMKVGDAVMSGRYNHAVHSYHQVCDNDDDDDDDDLKRIRNVNQTIDSTSPIPSSSSSSSSSSFDVISSAVYVKRWIHHLMLITATNTINSTLSHEAVNYIIALCHKYPYIHPLTSLECNLYMYVQLKQLQQQQQQQQLSGQQQQNSDRSDESNLSNIHAYMMSNEYSFTSENEYLLRNLMNISFANTNETISISDHRSSSVSSLSSSSSSSSHMSCWYLEHHLVLPELNIILMNV